MKNLNKKIGAVALAGMVVFGGFAAGGVQSFAAEQASSVVKEKIQDDGVQELQAMINLLYFVNIYKVLESSKDKKKLISKAEKICEGSKFFVRGSMKLNSKSPEKSLNNILGRKLGALVVKFGDNYYLIEGLL